MNEIKNITSETIKHLKHVNWFTNCGIKDTQNAIVLESWEQAIKECSSIKWENLCIETANNIALKVLKKDRERYKAWNKVAELIHPYADEIINKKVIPVKEENNLADVFVTRVSWDIIHLLIEAEYADIVKPTFYAGLSYWYVNGHFPCGWKGDLTTGKLIIY